MISTLLCDLGTVILFAKDSNYKGKLNPLHKTLSDNKNYSFLDHFFLNEELLNFLEKFRQEIEIFMLTGGTIQNAPEIKPKLDKVFKKVYSAKDLNLTKKDPNLYLQMAELLNKKPSEILFIDDLKANCAAAKEAGLKTIRYINNDQVIQEVDRLLSRG